MFAYFVLKFYTIKLKLKGDFLFKYDKKVKAY